MGWLVSHVDTATESCLVAGPVVSPATLSRDWNETSTTEAVCALASASHGLLTRMSASWLRRLVAVAVWPSTRRTNRYVLTVPMISSRIVVTPTMITSIRARRDSLRARLIGGRRSSALTKHLGRSVRVVLPLWPQAVADAALGVDERRAERVELAPQVADVGLHDLGLARVVPAPHSLQQLRPRQHPALVPHEIGQQPEFCWG